MSRRKSLATPSVLAIAIEDRVDAIVYRADETELFLHGAPLPEGGNYFEDVYECLMTVFDELADDGDQGPQSFFDALTSTVISVPGVVESNRTLLQLPLWHSHTDDIVRWRLDDEDREFFNFPEVLGDLVTKVLLSRGVAWPSDQRARFERQVFVVNDATAAAAFDHDRREEVDSSVIYVKLHNGVNTASIRRNKRADGRLLEAGEAGAFTIDTNHPEAGHSFPIPHPLDAGYGGSCPFHGGCFEGRVSVASMRERAESGLPAFKSWALALTLLEKEFEGQELDDRLHRRILEETPPAKGRLLMIDLLAHYAAHLVYQLALTFTPTKIVIGGRSAKPAVLEAIRQKVVTLSSGYPIRRGLGAGEIGDFIEAGIATTDEKKFVEVEGALVIARSRARTAGEDDNRPLPDNVTPISRHKAARQRSEKPLNR